MKPSPPGAPFPPASINCSPAAVRIAVPDRARGSCRRSNFKGGNPAAAA